ncbi:MAG: hypothetical protein KDE15_12610 [Erythrobacter sp.]|nr:hypothetical protein [Erythrobacter sp.]
MSLLFALVAQPSARLPADWPAMAAQSAAAWPADRVDETTHSQAAFLVRQRFATAHRGKAMVQQDGHTLLFDGRLDNRADLAAALGLGDGVALSDAELAFATWQRHGERLPEHLLGDFAIISHAADGGVTLIRDHTGVRPLFFAQGQGFLAVASAMPPLLALPFVDRRASVEWAADYLEEVKPDPRYTACRGIAIVPPARALHFASAAAPPVERRYWQLAADPPRPSLTYGEAVDEARRLFDRAVADRLAGHGRTASELSGGLDSSGIAVTAQAQLAQRGEVLLGLTQALRPQFADRYRPMSEGHFADAVYGHCPQIERLDLGNAVPSLLDVLRESLHRHGAPPRNDFNGFASEAPAQLYARDVRVLLSGFGGDQVVTNNAHALEASLLHQHRWLALARHLLRYPQRRQALRRLVSELRSTPARKNLQRPRVASPQLLAAAGYPARDALHQFPPARGPLVQRDCRFLDRPVLAWRMQDSQVGAGALGVEYRYPMLDVRLLEFVHALPVEYRLQPGRLRRLFRDMMGERLPELVRERRDKFGLTVPGVFSNVVEHAGELAAYLGARASDPATCHLGNYVPMLHALQIACDSGEFPKDTAVKAGETYSGARQGQVLRLAMLALWQESGLAEPLALPAGQPNQAV